VFANKLLIPSEIFCEDGGIVERNIFRDPRIHEILQPAEGVGDPCQGRVSYHTRSSLQVAGDAPRSRATAAVKGFKQLAHSVKTGIRILLFGVQIVQIVQV
jgi:hypothetical protein